jgi:Domain of unknown function (DUF4190)
MTFPGWDAGGNPGGPSDPGSSEHAFPPPAGGPPQPGYHDPNRFGQQIYSQPYPDGYAPPGRPGTNTMAVTSLVTSIVGFAPYFGGILSIVGIVLGAVALNQIKETPQDGYGLAVAGIVVGVATLIIGLIWTIYAMR